MIPVFSGVIVGRGDYKITHNSVFKGATGGTGPSPSFSNGGHTRVRHREFIQDVYSGIKPESPAGQHTVFYNASPDPSHYRKPSPQEPDLGTGFVLNPGCMSTFPWLSGIANNYQKYQWMGLVFEYVTSSGDALSSTNTALGTVIMATDYDTNHIPFTDKRLMENSDYSNSGKPSISQIHGIECDPAINPLKVSYVRPDYPAERDEQGAVTDLRFSDHGRFQIGTIGCQEASQILGELWVTYDVILLCPDQDVKLPEDPNCGNVVGDASFCPNFDVCGVTQQSIICDTGLVASREFNIPTPSWDLLADPAGVVSRLSPFPRGWRTTYDIQKYGLTVRYGLPELYSQVPLWNTTTDARLHVFDWYLARDVSVDGPISGYSGLVMPGLDGIDVPLELQVPGQINAYFRVTFRWEITTTTDSAVFGNAYYDPESLVYAGNVRKRVGGVLISTENIRTHYRTRPTFPVMTPGYTNPDDDVVKARGQDVSYGMTYSNSQITPCVSHMEATIDVAIPYRAASRTDERQFHYLSSTGLLSAVDNAPAVYIDMLGNNTGNDDSAFMNVVTQDNGIFNKYVSFRIKSRMITHAEYLLDVRTGTSFIPVMYDTVLPFNQLVPVPAADSAVEPEDGYPTCCCAAAHCNCG